MTTLVKELRDALVDAGANPELADRAAAAVIGNEQAASRLDIALLKTDIAELEARLIKAMWMQSGVTITVIVALLKLLP